MKVLVRCQPILLAVLEIHAPEAEAIHRLAKGVVLIEELDRAHDVEQDFRVLAHPECMDCAGVLTDIISLLGLPSVPVAWIRYSIRICVCILNIAVSPHRLSYHTEKGSSDVL